MRFNYILAAFYVSFTFLLAACGGAGSTGGSAPPSDQLGGAPSITSFSAANTTISAGGSTSLTAIFSNGSGNINNSVGNVTSGVSVSVSPSSTTTYTLTVTDSTGASVSSLLTVTVLPVTTPVVLAFGTSQIPYSATLATYSTAYFQITGLTAGHRYTFDISTPDYSTTSINYFSDAYVTEIKCDPNAGSPCVMIAPGSAVWIRVHNLALFKASSIAINSVNHISAPAEFEGAWNAALPLDYLSGGSPHVGKVDKFISYYQFQNLTIGKTYTYWVQSMSNDVRMDPLNPVTRTWVGGVCAPGNTYINGASMAENCTVTATTSSSPIFGIQNTLAAASAAYILRVEEAVASEGSAGAPVTLLYSGSKAAARGRVGVGSASYYKVTGLQAGTSYSLNVNGIERSVAPAAYDPPSVQSYDADATYTTASACSALLFGSSPIQCKLTASSTTLYFKVVGPVQFSGVTYNVSLTAIPVNEGATVPLALNYATSLPYKGQIYDYFSSYKVSGLVPNAFYQVFLKDITGSIGMEAWEDSVSVISGGDSSQTTATYFLNSGANGIINVRASGYGTYGSFYTLAMTPAPLLSADHQDKSGPIAIQDPTVALNPVTPTTVPIVVSGDPVTSIANVTVELFIRHGIASQLTLELIAPDGVTTVTLAAANTLNGASLYNLKLNDYAPVRVQDGQAPYYGTYRPQTPLHVLNGMNANGTWTLRIKDDQYTNISSQTGEYYAWGISFK
jgi:subtilisin-like proprotein convertase family protein